MNRITCTCVDVPVSVADLCAYCRAEYYRTLKLAMLSDRGKQFRLTCFGITVNDSSRFEFLSDLVEYRKARAA